MRLVKRITSLLVMALSVAVYFNGNESDGAYLALVALFILGSAIAFDDDR